MISLRRAGVACCKSWVKPRLQACILMAAFLLSVAGVIGAPAAFAETKKTKTSQTKSQGITLYGQIDEMSYFTSSAGVRLSNGKLPATVEKISLGSAAAYSGLRTGDTVLSAKYDDTAIVFDIERKGKKYQARVATNVRGLKDEFESRKIKFSFGDSAFDKELKQLRDIKVVLLVDRSLSMADMHAGVPGDVSKWIWCKEQIDNVYLATDRVLEGGFDVYLFNDRIESRLGVTLWDLKQVFDTVKPAGEHKNIGSPLNSILHEYFSRRSPKSKPCIVVVLTDGTENVGPPLQEVLIDASKQMTRPGEVVVTFMQIGDSISAEELFDDLDRNLVAKGAKYHMVNYKPFAELRNRGVLYELLQSVKDISKPPSSTPPATPK